MEALYLIQSVDLEIHGLGTCVCKPRARCQKSCLWRVRKLRVWNVRAGECRSREGGETDGGWDLWSLMEECGYFSPRMILYFRVEYC